MLITQLKSKCDILSLVGENTVAFICNGCNEVYFPETESTEVLRELSCRSNALVVLTTNYICNPENLELQVHKHMSRIDSADMILVFSCGIGVQTVAERLSGIPVFAACDTYPLPGYQGVTPLEYDCAQCGECYLNDTGGICPITACSKSLINGPCGGTINGKCEVDKDMECGWERIYKRLKTQGLPDDSHHQIKLRNFQA